MLLLAVVAIGARRCRRADEAGNDNVRSGHGVIAARSSTSNASTLFRGAAELVRSALNFACHVPLSSSRRGSDRFMHRATHYAVENRWDILGC